MEYFFLRYSKIVYYKKSGIYTSEIILLNDIKRNEINT